MGRLLPAIAARRKFYVFLSNIRKKKPVKVAKIIKMSLGIMLSICLFFRKSEARILIKFMLTEKKECISYSFPKVNLLSFHHHTAAFIGGLRHQLQAFFHTFSHIKTVKFCNSQFLSSVFQFLVSVFGKFCSVFRKFFSVLRIFQKQLNNLACKC